jgi:hypothetical protein
MGDVNRDVTHDIAPYALTLVDRNHPPICVTPAKVAMAKASKEGDIAMRYWRRFCVQISQCKRSVRLLQSDGKTIFTLIV